MKAVAAGVGASVLLAGLAAYVARASDWGARGEQAFVTTVPVGYRDWRFVSVARELGTLDDIRAVLGNDVAIRAYRKGQLPFPDGAMLVRLAYAFEASPENDAAFGRHQSFVAGAPKNGVQFMVKDSKTYAATGGWGYGHFEQGSPAEVTMLQACHPCHRAVESRDFVFTRYAP